MKKYVISFLFLGLAVPILAVKIISLPEIVIPHRMATDGKNLYILQRSHEVAIFSLDELRVVKTFGRKGAGPTEFKFLPMMTATPDYIFFSTVEKYLVFSNDGRFIREKRLPQEAAVIPFGEKFVVIKHIGLDVKQRKQITTINLWDSNFKNIKEFHKRSEPMTMMFMGVAHQKGTIPILSSHFSIHIDENKIFVVDGEKGFHIDVFDAQGNRLYTIKKDLEKIRVTSRMKEKLIADYLENDPGMKKMWKEVKKNNDILLPEYLPPIKFARVVDSRIYVNTYETKEGQS